MVKSKSQETYYYGKQKKEVYKVKPMTEGKRNIIQGLLQEYDIEIAEDMKHSKIFQATPLKK